MMEERNIRPWRKVARNFSEKPAKMIEKLWLVKEMVLHGETAKDLSKLYGIGRKAWNRWSEAYKDRGILQIECLRNEKKKISVDISMDFLESEEISFNPWIEYPWIAVYFIDPWMKFGYK